MCRAAEEGRAGNEGWRLRADGSRFWGSGQTMPLVDSDGQLRGFLKILRDQTERHQSKERRALLLRELGHRVKNALATAQAVAAQTLRQAGAPADLRATFEARLMALARSHDMLSQSDWEGAPLHEVVERTLEPYAADGEVGRVTVNGRPVRLAPNTTVTLNLALHELATNAAKYGALSLPGGRIEVTWDLEQRLRNSAPAVTIFWRERVGHRCDHPSAAASARGCRSMHCRTIQAAKSRSTSRRRASSAAFACRLWSGSAWHDREKQGRPVTTRTTPSSQEAAG
ncbi:HWE histidine kinase domain-containing protein [Siccirubricoccus deserti]